MKVRLCKPSKSALEPLEPRTLLASATGFPVTVSGPSYDAAFQIAIDSTGCKIVAGIFGGTADFQPGSAVTSLTSVGETDLFVAKYTPRGKLLWAERFGGGSGEITDNTFYSPIQQSIGDFINRNGPTIPGAGEYLNDMVVGPNDTIYFAGSFQGTADFDPGPGMANMRSTSQYQDAFVAKLKSDGSLVWAKNFGGAFDDVARGLAVDAIGNAYVTGYFTRGGDADPGSGVHPMLTTGRNGIFVTELSTNGKFIWSNSYGSKDTEFQARDSGEDIALDAAGNVYLTGSFADEIQFFHNTLQAFNLDAIGASDSFLMKLTNTGTLTWAKSFGGDHLDAGAGIAVGPNGAIYTTGYFSRDADLDPGPRVELFVAADEGGSHDSETDIYVSKFNPDGTLVWARQLRAAGFTSVQRIAVDANGSTTLTGAFAGTVDFNPMSGRATLTSVLGRESFDDGSDRDFSFDAFVSRLSANGKYLAAAQFGGVSDDYGIGLAIDPNDPNQIALAGRFKGTVVFGSGAMAQQRKSAGDDGFALVLDASLGLV